MLIKDRTKGCGASDAAAICRMSKYRDQVDVFHEKTGTGKPKAYKDSPLMLAGRIHEPGLLAYLELQTGKTLKIHPEWFAQAQREIDDPEFREYLAHNEEKRISKHELLYFHKKYDYMYCHVDGMTEDNITVEVKFISNPVYGDWKNVNVDGYDAMDSIPLQYYYQLQFNMMVTGCKEAILVAMIPGAGDPHRIYTIERNAAFIVEMRKKIKSFWNDNVLKKVPPQPLTREEVIKLTPTPRSDKYVEANLEQIILVKDLQECSKEIKALQVTKKQLQDKIAVFINDAEGLKVTNEEGSAFTSPNGKKGQVIDLATFRPTKSGTRTLRLNAKGVQNA